MSSDGKPEQRARDVLWFEVRTYPTGRHGGGRPSRRAYGDPRVYVVASAAFPLAFVLAGIDPFGWPRWIYGALIFGAGLPVWNMVRSWAEDLKFPAYSLKGADAQAWLYVGGALPQAVRALRQQRGRTSESPQ